MASSKLAWVLVLLNYASPDSNGGAFRRACHKRSALVANQCQTTLLMMGPPLPVSNIYNHF